MGSYRLPGPPIFTHEVNLSDRLSERGWATWWCNLTEVAGLFYATAGWLEYLSIYITVLNACCWTSVRSKGELGNFVNQAC